MGLDPRLPGQGPGRDPLPPGLEALQGLRELLLGLLPAPGSAPPSALPHRLLELLALEGRDQGPGLGREAAPVRPPRGGDRVDPRPPVVPVGPLGHALRRVVDLPGVKGPLGVVPEEGLVQGVGPLLHPGPEGLLPPGDAPEEGHVGVGLRPQAVKQGVVPPVGGQARVHPPPGPGGKEPPELPVEVPQAPPLPPAPGPLRGVEEGVSGEETVVARVRPVVGLQQGLHLREKGQGPLQAPLPPGREGSLKGALALLAEVEALLEAYYGADPGYNGLLSRNPFLHPPEWTWGGGKRWSLRDLHRELRGLLPSGTRRRVDPGLASYGRNNALFDRLRAEAYAHVALFRGVPGGEEAFRAWVEQRAHALNQSLFRDHPKGPLDPREVHHTAKSVAKWTYRNYRGARVYPVSSTGRPDRSRLSPQARALIPPLQGQELQEAVREGGRRRGSRRRQEAEEKLTEALKRLQARGERVTARALAREAGVKPHTASKWLKRMRE